MIAADPPALHCRGIRVTYGEVTALAELSIAFERGAIHAVVGQNGAGKTTFARVAAGLIRPDAGSLHIDGRPLRLGRVAGARAAGVELVHQSFALPPSFTVAEALEFGASGGIGLYGRRQLLRRCRDRLAALDLDVDPRRRIRDLPVEAQQGVEIARALVTDARVLILDEPTAVLPPSGIEALFERIRGLRRHGVTVILILHKIREVLAVADTISVLRGGRLVAGPLPRAGADETSIAETIIGGATAASADADDTVALVGAAPFSGGGARDTHEEPPPASRGAVLTLASVSTAKEPEEPALDRVSLSVAPGEIVGVAGVQGNGQRTLVKAVAGLADVVGRRHPPERHRRATREPRPTPRAGLAGHPVRAQQRGPEPHQRALGELVCPRPASEAAVQPRRSGRLAAPMRRVPQGLGGALRVGEPERRRALRRQCAEGDPRARDR